MIAKRKTKPKRASLSTLVNKADRLASLYIRRKHADHTGNVVCISCDTVLPWKDAHCAHYIDRAKKATRWMEENLHPACCHCNSFNKQFHMREYTIKMIDMYGRDFVDEIRESVKKTLSASEVRMLAEEAIEYYGKMDFDGERD